MCQCSPPATQTVRQSARLSVHRIGEEEAQQFKWIESQKAGRDLGEAAIRCWVHDHWRGFLRARWLEHLQGRTFWIELDNDDFGLLQREFRDSELINPVLAMLKKGEENLAVLDWAQRAQLSRDEILEILEILEALDINSRRIECRFGTRIAQTG